MIDIQLYRARVGIFGQKGQLKNLGRNKEISEYQFNKLTPLLMTNKEASKNSIFIISSTLLCLFVLITVTGSLNLFKVNTLKLSNPGSYELLRSVQGTSTRSLLEKLQVNNVHMMHFFQFFGHLFEKFLVESR